MRPYTVLVLQIFSHPHLIVCYIARFLHKLRGVFRSRLDCTFERHGIPEVTLRDGQHSLHANRCLEGNIPNDTVMEFSFGRLWISILVQGRFNVERREYASDDNVKGPESKAFARTGPRSTIIHRRGRCDRYLSPPPRSEYPILGIERQGVDISVLEEPIRVEGFRVGVDVRITTNRPGVLYHSGSCGDKVYPVYVVLRGFDWDADGGG